MKTLLLVILIAIVVTGIMNTMWIAIRERTREIGTLRAIGMHRRGILSMFLFESLLLGLGSAVAGAIAGAIIAAGLNALQISVPEHGAVLSDVRPPAPLDPREARWWGRSCMLTVLTGVAALYPSFRAARLRPVEAMSHFG